MINALVKYIPSLMLVFGAVGLTLKTEDIFFYVACFTALIFGFLQRLAQIRDKQPLTFGAVIWNLIKTIGICILAVSMWLGVGRGLDFYFVGYIFLSSFFAATITQSLDNVGIKSIPELFTLVARKWLSSRDKEEDDK